jgi:hypothetical protein
MLGVKKVGKKHGHPNREIRSAAITTQRWVTVRNAHVSSWVAQNIAPDSILVQHDLVRTKYYNY